MSAVEAPLPAGFESLQPFVPGWAVSGAEARHRRRIGSSEADREAFFDAVAKILPGALAHLDRKPLAALDAREKELMNLLLTFAHVAPAVEQQRDHEPMHAVGADRITITRTTADFAP